LVKREVSEMTDRRVAELREKLGHPTCETIQLWRLLKAFVRLPPSQRAELIEMIQLVATNPAPARE
jgi:hypothetical protein